MLFDPPEGELGADIEVVEVINGFRFWGLTDRGDAELGVAAGHSVLMDKWRAASCCQIWKGTKMIVESAANLDAKMQR